MKYVRDKEGQQDILRACHLDPTSGHMGVKRTLRRITERYTWCGITKDVKKFVSNPLYYNNYTIIGKMNASKNYASVVYLKSELCECYLSHIIKILCAV